MLHLVTTTATKTPSDRCHVKQGDQFLTYDFGGNAIYFAPASCRYTFPRAQAEALAARYGGEVVDEFETKRAAAPRSRLVAV
jgi:hypothetical protein